MNKNSYSRKVYESVDEIIQAWLICIIEQMNQRANKIQFQMEPSKIGI